MTEVEFNKTSIGCKEERSAEGRRPVVKPALGAESRQREQHGNGKNGRPRWLEKSENGSRGRPLECAPKKALTVGFWRLRFCGCDLLHAPGHN